MCFVCSYFESRIFFVSVNCEADEWTNANGLAGSSWSDFFLSSIALSQFEFFFSDEEKTREKKMIFYCIVFGHRCRRCRREHCCTTSILISLSIIRFAVRVHVSVFCVVFLFLIFGDTKFICAAKNSPECDFGVSIGRVKSEKLFRRRIGAGTSTSQTDARRRNSFVQMQLTDIRSIHENEMEQVNEQPYVWCVLNGWIMCFDRALNERNGYGTVEMRNACFFFLHLNFISVWCNLQWMRAPMPSHFGFHFPRELRQRPQSVEAYLVCLFKLFCTETGTTDGGSSLAEL